MGYIVFSVDDEDEIHTLKKFLKYVDDCTVLGKIKNPVIPCIGYYEGILENSFIMDEEDYPIVKDWVKEQVFVLRVEALEEGASAQMMDPSLIHCDYIGHLSEWDYTPIFDVWGLEGPEDWTYRKDTKKYYTVER